MLSLQEVRQALDLAQFDSTQAQLRMRPVPRAMTRTDEKEGDPRQGAVLVLLFQRQGRIHFVLTRRRDDLATHAGQISLPGGRREDGEPLQETALREAHEEVGIDPQAVRLLGSLASLYILPSDFEVFPFVGWHEEEPAFVPQLSEVAEIIEVPLAHILDERLRQEEVWERKGVSMIVPYFQIDEHKVWGATAMMLSEFAERLREQSDGNLATNP